MEEELNKIDLNALNDDVQIIDIASKLQDYDESEIVRLCSALSDEKLAMVLEQTDEDTQVQIIDSLTNQRALSVFDFMQKDDIVDILGNLSIGRCKQLINLMKAGDKKIIATLLGYKDDTAGGIMTTEFITMNKKYTLDEAIKKIQSLSPKTELLDTIFVTDDNKHLIGTAELRDIIIEDDAKTLNDITSTNFVYVEPEVDQEEVARMVSKYNLTVIPVVSKNMIMLGIITVDDIIDVLEEEQTEDILQMGGANKEETIDSTMLESIRLRLPWLLVNLLTAFLAAMAVKVFENTIAQVVALSAIMGIISGMGGNAGSQTISIVIRSIALGKIHFKDGIKRVWREIFVGIINGLAIGLVAGVVVALIYGNWFLCLIVLLAMMCNLAISGLFGILVPLVLEKLHADPALSSSIFVTTATDTLGFFVFLGLANIFLPMLI